MEDAALDWFRELGYHVQGGPDMSPGSDSLHYPLRASHADAVLTSAVRGSLRRLNADLPEEALDDALRRLTRPVGATLEARSRSFHRMLVDGVNVEYRDADGAVRGAQASVVDFDEPDANMWSAINQFTVSENGNTRRPDIVVFVNGLPLAVIELKNPADENATIWSAFHQLQTYKSELPALFACNAVLLVSDGLQARLGTLSAGREWFKPWRTIGGAGTGAYRAIPSVASRRSKACSSSAASLALAARLRIVVEDDGGSVLVKKMAGYHQFHAVQVAVRRDTARGGARAFSEQRFDPAPRPSGRYAGGQCAGRGPRRPADRCRLAHAGFGQEPDDGVLRRPDRSRTGDGEPHGRRAHRPERPRRPALRLRSPVAVTCSRQPSVQAARPRRPPLQARGRRRRRRVHDHPEVLPGGEGRSASAALPSGATSSSSRMRLTGASTSSSRATPAICGTRLPNASFIGFTGTPIELEDANTRERVWRLHQRLRHPALGQG